ncbi:hypothetical protein HanRHA438_Chr05g0229211 [Helianthus annuus]|uniref:Uncharacterized protein n=1 Tax=Helianthus annuus TaxID=4232 RepID=A0A9K3NN18_HELAN|nr:uncharacterized protein LOC110941304 [Helianthus annuus]KAF5806346.1 hypothetical protein HanXRQr2_Chr05g0220291 [Helianthus annuus]KAJ0570630.1 hypothetical protein HanHA300_Chr05g0180221 [Helianthus annuus]KAJ0577520.1 hypothetical protein HanIR_Chr05g0236901 [Helianthus annuus]KAJ0584972.1 hypothetical protein HanHA89_Chr05g0194911 [Helianthus annuus]KAJ0919401.1 hypothetical protein HanRHA438_Chr05g0229211 [Helianthus annuus]
MDRRDRKYITQLKGISYDIRMCDYGSIKPCYNKLKNGKLGDQESDNDYAWFLDFLIENGELTKDVVREDQNEYESENEDEDVRVDENNKDPEHLLFFENLSEHGKSYKLKISQDDEEPWFLYYEEPVNSDRCDDLQTCSDDSGDEVTVSEDTQIKQQAKRRRNEKSGRISTKKEVSKRKKINVSIKDKTMTQPPRGQGNTAETCHNVSINGANSAVKCKEEPVEYEMDVTTCDSDSDVVILDNVQNCSEVNNKQLVLAEKEPSLRDKLINILKHPYNEEEYKLLSEYIEKEKPVCQLKPLRNGRSRAFAETGVNKSVLDYGPERFQRMLDAAHEDPPKALNLLRMFRFWLEHAPNDDAFQPWREKQFLKVRPSEKNALTHM